MNTEIIEFIENNKEEIKAYIEAKLKPYLLGAHIFINHPDIYDDYLDEKRRRILNEFLTDHFMNLPPGTLLFNDEILKSLKEN